MSEDEAASRIRAVIAAKDRKVPESCATAFGRPSPDAGLRQFPTSNAQLPATPNSQLPTDPAIGNWGWRLGVVGSWSLVVGRYAANILSKLPPKIRSWSAAGTPPAVRAVFCASYTPRCHPRGKNDESVPNSRRRAPTTEIAVLNTDSSVRPGV